jgi:hypothetical protein
MYLILFEPGGVTVPIIKLMNAIMIFVLNSLSNRVNSHEERIMNTKVCPHIYVCLEHVLCFFI